MSTAIFCMVALAIVVLVQIRNAIRQKEKK